MMLRTHKAALAGVAMQAFVIGSVAQAQVAAPETVEAPAVSNATENELESDIVVTASRQGGQRLQQVPLAI